MRGAKAKIFAPEFLKLIGWAPRAKGGPVTKGQGYVVGEERAEFFVPKQDGYILPSVPKASASGGGNTTVINNFDIDIHIPGGAGNAQIEQIVERAIRKALDEAGRRANTQIQLRSITKK